VLFDGSVLSPTGCQAPDRFGGVADVYVFADEAGNFDFSLQTGASRYFIIATVVMNPAVIGSAISRLRYDLGWRGVHLDEFFHATTDPQAVRDEVFASLASLPFRVDATILDKRKAQPHLQSERALYKMGWYLHFKFVAPRIVRQGDRLFVAAASIGTKKKRGLFHAAVHDVVFQVSPVASYRVAFWPAASETCLQVADYCTWAIQRRWEQSDPRSHALIASKVGSEFGVWQVGAKHYY